MAKVLLGSAPPETLGEVREALEAAGHTVTAEEDAEAILKAARSGAYRLLVVAEELEGGTGGDVCSVLDGMAGRPKLLFIGREAPSGADASVPPDEIFGIVEQALALLEVGVTPGPIPDPQSSISRDVDKQLGWSGASPPVEKVSVRVKAPEASRKPPLNGGSRSNGNAAEHLQAMLRKVRESDYFEILGIPLAASDAQVREAYAERRRQVAAFAREAATRAAAEEIQTVLEDALQVLGDPALRAAYARNRG